MKKKANTSTGTEEKAVPTLKASPALVAACNAVTKAAATTEAARQALEAAKAISANSIVSCGLLLRKECKEKETAKAWLDGRKVNETIVSKILAIAYSPVPTEEIETEAKKIKPQGSKLTKEEKELVPANLETVLKVARQSSKRNKKGVLVPIVKSGKGAGGHNKLTPQDKLGNGVAAAYSEKAAWKACDEEQAMTTLFNALIEAGADQAKLEAACAKLSA